MDNLTNVCEATSQSQELDNIRPTHRKGRKLLAEKKRRARINNCLKQIRQLVCEDHDEQDTDIDKMEKAEILEKTLEVLTRLRHENPVSSNTASTHTAMAIRYASGFSLCAEESIRYIQSSRLVPSEVKVQLQNHLRAIARRVELTVQVNGQGSNLTPGFPASSSTLSSSSPPSSDKLLAGEMLSSFSDYSSAVEQVSAQCSGDVSEGIDRYMTSPLCYSTDGSSRHITSPICYSTPIPYQHLPFIKLSKQEVDHSRLSYSSEPCIFRSVDERRKSTRRRAPEAPGKSTQERPAKHILSLSSGSQIDTSEGYWSDSSQRNHSYLPQSSSLSSSFQPRSPFYSDSSFTNSPTLVVNSSLVSTPQSIPYRAVYTYPRFKHYLTTPSMLGETTQALSSNLLTPTIKEVTTPSNVLDLCVKRTDDQQVSPEAMWRPW